MWLHSSDEGLTLETSAFQIFHGGNFTFINSFDKTKFLFFTAQLVEHRTGVAEVTGSNPVEALIFFRLLPSNCLNWKNYCDDHSSLSSTTAVQYEFHMYFTLKLFMIWRLCYARINVWLRCLPWQRGWLKTRFRKWFLFSSQLVIISQKTKLLRL